MNDWEVGVFVTWLFLRELGLDTCGLGGWDWDVALDLDISVSVGEGGLW